MVEKDDTCLVTFKPSIKILVLLITMPRSSHIEHSLNDSPVPGQTAFVVI